MKTSKTRGATKVANVKLRPAQASSSLPSRRQASVPRVGLRDDDATQGEVDLNVGNKPFKGVVLCATGDLDKRTLFAHAQELGAIRANDFTDQVTHLVADAAGSPKYRCAVERQLPILKESWVEEAYQTWLNGGVVDFEQTVIAHRLPIFSGVRLCLTGMDDLKARGRIHALLAKENGVYLTSLDHTATHLLACASGESPKLQWATEYNKDKDPSSIIQLVWEEWFWDSLEFGGRWNEREYGITRPRPSRKLVSEFSKVIDNNSSRNELPTATLSQRSPLPSSVPTSSLLGDDPPEYGNMNKLPRARQVFYSSIFQQREKDPQHNKDADTSNGQALAYEREKMDPETTRARRNPTVLAAAAEQDLEPDSVLTRLASHRVASFGPSTRTQSRQPFRRIASSAAFNTNGEPRLESPSIPSASASTSTSQTASHLFLGYKFRAFGEAKGVNIQDALEAHGGRWLTEDDDEADFLIVRLVSGGMYWRDEADETERAKYRTECWLERCIFEERICAPHEHIVYTPLKIDTPVAGSEKLCVSLSGLDTAEVCWAKRLIRALGASLSPTFSRNSTHLVCPCGRGAKFDKAKEWGIETVGMEWLIHIASSGQVPDAKQFPVRVECSTMDIDIKGKSKASENGDEDKMILDITNGASQESEPSKRHDSLGTVKYSTLQQQEKHPTTHASLQSTPVDTSTRTPILQRYAKPESAVTFGKPGELLSMSSSPRKDAGHAPLPPAVLCRPSSTFSPTRAGPINRRFSAAEVEQDKQMTLIPSSHSPSPLKIPSKLVSVASPPVRETRGLRTAITALLGKRGTEGRDDVDMDVDGQAQTRQGRASKRLRPPTRSKSDLEPRRGPSPVLSLLSGSPPLSRLPYSQEVDAIPDEAEASLRVVYQDPGQRAEKRRLIALFEGGTTPDVSNHEGTKDVDSRKGKLNSQLGTTNTKPATKRKSARRSTRTSGS